jgi:hypothetical protein
MAANSIAQVNYSSVMAYYSKDMTLLRQINALTEVNDMLADAPVREATDIDSDMVARVTALATPYWHKLGEGLTASMGHIQQATEGIAMLRNQWRGNREIVDRQPNPPGYMERQEQLILEGMNQEIANTLVYGNAGTAPEEFTGIDPRYDAITAGSVFNNGATSGDNGSLTSAWLIQWNIDDCTMIFPRGSAGGLRRIPKGVLTLSTETDATGSVEATKALAEFYCTNFEWDTGLCIQDTRRVKRVANIHKTRGNANEINVDVLIEAFNAFKTSGTVYLYVPTEVKTQLQVQAKDKGNVYYPPDTPFGKPVAHILDMPIRQSDAILTTENALS